jgi:hypothetical protein
LLIIKPLANYLPLIYPALKALLAAKAWLKRGLKGGLKHRDYMARHSKKCPAANMGNRADLYS